MTPNGQRFEVIEVSQGSSHNSFLNHVFAATNMHTAVEELLAEVLSDQSDTKSHETENNGSWVLWDLKQRMTVLVRTSSNLIDRGRCTTPIVMRQKNMVKMPTGLGTKNDSAGKDQQQFTQLTDCSWR
jgi:hypothetical protein